MKQNSLKNKHNKSEHKCSFCGKEFVRENSLINHSCRYKIRYFEKDNLYSRIAFEAYNKFYLIAQKSNKNKTLSEFIKSQYYSDFIKFGRYVVNNSIQYPEYFIEFCIKNSVPLINWVKPSVYEIYLREMAKKEDPDRGIERTLLLMKQWSDETGNDYRDFFRNIETTLFVHYIQQGRISPWVLYNTVSGKQILEERLSQDQLSIISSWIDPDYWHKKFLLNKKDREEIAQIFIQEGL